MSIHDCKLIKLPKISDSTGAELNGGDTLLRALVLRRLLRRELARPGYRCELISLGANTDPYQPVEREYRITRQILEVLAECGHPVGIVTKSALIERDIDILAAMARKQLVNVYISVNNLDHELARRLEPRCPALSILPLFMT